ncbi:hypothetical protein FB446DRAFT_791734 [Lentinula raphanica]|nr:hypothetical protein FB446DRAFT_791734 [Lentinula raphanica]
MFNSLFLRLVVPVLVLWTVVVLSFPIPTGRGVAATTQHTPISVQLMITHRGGEYEHWWFKTGALIFDASTDEETWISHPTEKDKEDVSLRIDQIRLDPGARVDPEPEIVELGKMKEHVTVGQVIEAGKEILGWGQMRLNVVTSGGTCMDLPRMGLELLKKKDYIDQGVMDTFMKVYEKEYTPVSGRVIKKELRPPSTVTLPSSTTG